MIDPIEDGFERSEAINASCVGLLAPREPPAKKREVYPLVGLQDVFDVNRLT